MNLDRKNLPGKIINNIFKFNRLEYKVNSGKTNFWQIFVTLFKKLPTMKYSINWDLDQNIIYSLNTNLFNGKINDIPKNVIACVWVERGIVNKQGETKYKTTREIPTYITKGKNIGKKNETTIFIQAILEARSKYNKIIKSKISKQDRFKPVLVHPYKLKNLPRNIKKHIRYPVAVQRKLDGGRVIIYLDVKLDKVIIYSRSGDDICCNEHIKEELYPLFKKIYNKYPHIYLDGEIYKHGLSLQVISGLMRRSKERNKESTGMKLEFHIFDIFFPKGDKKTKSMAYIDRKKVLDDIFKISKKLNNKLKYIKHVETFISNNKQEETKLYHTFLENGYEGSIVRNLDAPYEIGKRSYQLRKRKPRFDSEYEIVGYKEGKQGKDKGAIIWILKTSGNERKNIPSIEFTSTPVGMNYEERKKLFKNLNENIFNKKYKGKMMTVEYDDISDEGVPLRAKAKCVRTIS